MKAKPSILVNIVLATVLLTSIFLIRMTTSVAEYDPLVDVNDDGFIELSDFFILSQHFGSSGTPINKTALLLEVQTARAHNITFATSLETISGYPGLNWQDMPDMTLEITVETENDEIVLKRLHWLQQVSGTWEQMYVRAHVDATYANPPGGVLLTATDTWTSCSYTFYSTNVAPGIHTVRIQWQIYDELGSADVTSRTLAVTTLLS